MTQHVRDFLAASLVLYAGSIEMRGVHWNSSLFYNFYHEIDFVSCMTLARATYIDLVLRSGIRSISDIRYFEAFHRPDSIN